MRRGAQLCHLGGGRESVPGRTHSKSITLNIAPNSASPGNRDRIPNWTAERITHIAMRAKRTVAKARMAMCVIRSAVQFGILSRLPGLAEFGAMLSVMEFEMVRPRDAFATAAEVAQLRAAAHRLGQPRAALAYALQFETTLRQWDVRGQWVDLSDKRPSAIIDRGKKWVSGPMWSDIDKNLILRWRPSKTDGTTGIEVVGTT